MTHHLDIFMSGKNLGLNGLIIFGASVFDACFSVKMLFTSFNNKKKVYRGGD